MIPAGTPFERTHWSYERIRTLLRDNPDDPLDAVIVAELERPGCTSDVTENVVIFYCEHIRDKPLPPGIVHPKASLRTIHYVAIEPKR